MYRSYSYWACSVDFFITWMITPVVNIFGIYAVDSIPVYSYGSDAHSTSEFPNIRCSL